MSILEINLFVLFRQSKQVTVAEKQVAEFLEVLAHLARSIKGKKLLAESRSNGANVLARSVKMSRNSKLKISQTVVKMGFLALRGHSAP